jgi:hypothetical protein
MQITTYNQHVRLLSRQPWLKTTQVYRREGADAIMESDLEKQVCASLS